MKEKNLITSSSITIQHLEKCLAQHFPIVRAYHDTISAQIERLSSDFVNELFVGDGFEHAHIIDKPSALSEYFDDELAFVLETIRDPKVFVIQCADTQFADRIAYSLRALGVALIDDLNGSIVTVDNH